MLQPVEAVAAQAVKLHLTKIESDNVPQDLGGGSMGSTEELERKRRHLNHHHHPVSPPLKKPAITSVSDEKKVLFVDYATCIQGYNLNIFLFFWGGGELSRFCFGYNTRTPVQFFTTFHKVD